MAVLLGSYVGLSARYGGISVPREVEHATKAIDNIASIVVIRPAGRPSASLHESVLVEFISPPNDLYEKLPGSVMRCDLPLRKKDRCPHQDYSNRQTQTGARCQYSGSPEGILHKPVGDC